MKRMIFPAIAVALAMMMPAAVIAQPNFGHRTDHRDDRDRDQRRDHRGGLRPWNWNRYPRDFNRHDYERNYGARRHFHWNRYVRPRGWYSHRWGVGEMLPSLFWSEQYRIGDYWSYDLPIPPYGYVWVRYGDDALLVNVRTGRILQVVYGLFD